MNVTVKTHEVVELILSPDFYVQCEEFFDSDIPCVCYSFQICRVHFPTKHLISLVRKDECDTALEAMAFHTKMFRDLIFMKDHLEKVLYDGEYLDGFEVCL